MRNLSKAVRDSLSSATYIFAIVGTIASVAGISVRGAFPELPVWMLVFLVLAAYLLLTVLIRACIFLRMRVGARLNVNGNLVEIKVGDLFSCEGWKVIPFNEFYDTAVDDITISKRSLNGIFIENHVVDLDDLNSSIKNDVQTSLSSPKANESGKLKFELGTLKRFNGEYLLLAFSHFNELNEAHLTMAEYEQCLINLWREINRVYAGIPVYIPLLGSGLTRFDESGWSPSKQDLLKCMICTLRISKSSFTAPINIVLTEEAYEESNLYDLKSWV